MGDKAGSAFQQVNITNVEGYPPMFLGQYSYQGVLEFLREQEARVQEREGKLIGEKRQLEERVRALEEELQKQVALNKEMANKVRLIEFQMIQRGGPGTNNGGGKP